MADPVAWPFYAGGEQAVELGWLTDVLPPATGREQRRRLRETPHIWLSFDGLDSGDERRRLEQRLHVNGAGAWWMPWPMQGQTLGATLASGATSIPVDTRWRHYRAGGRALLVGAGGGAEVVEVDAMDDVSLTLLEPTVAAWPAGTSIYPAFRAVLDGMIEIPRFTGDDGPYSARFLADEPIDWIPPSAALTYRGVPVLDIPTEWTTDPLDAPERDLVRASNEITLPFVYDPVGQPRNRIRIAATARGVESIAGLWDLMYMLAGRAGIVWVPSLAQDFRVVANVSNGATTLDVAATGFSTAPLADNRRDIRIVLANGTSLYRRITAATAPSSGVERLTLDSPIATGFAAANVVQVAFLQLCRQEADTNLLRYWTWDVARTIFEFRGEAHHGL